MNTAISGVCLGNYDFVIAKITDISLIVTLSGIMTCSKLVLYYIYSLFAYVVLYLLYKLSK